VADGGGITVRELITKLGWDVDEDTIKRFDRAVGTAKVGLLALVGASVAAGAALLGVTISATRAGEEVLATAELVGLTVEEFQKYRHAAALAEVSNEQFSTSMRFLTRNVGDALRGQGEAGKAFQKLGITLTDASGKTRDSGAILRDVADRFQQIQDPAARASLSMDLFGRGGVRMGRFLMQGSAGLEAASAAVSTFGLFSDAGAKEADALGDSLLNLKALAGGLRNELGQRLFKTVRDISERMQKWLVANSAVIKQKLDKFVERLTQALAVLLAVGEKVAKVFFNLIKNLGGFNNTIKLVLFGLAALISTLAILNLSLIAVGAAALAAWAKMLFVPALIAFGIFLLIAAIEDLYVWLKDGDSVIGQWLGSFEKFNIRVKEIWTSVKETFRSGMDFIESLFALDFKRSIKDAEKVMEGLEKTADRVINTLTGGRFTTVAALLTKVTPGGTATQGVAGGFTGGFGGPNLAAAGLAGGFVPSSLVRPSAVAGGSSSQQATVNNYVTVPPGTPQQQVDAIRGAVAEVVDDRLRRSFDHVNQENPEVD